MHGAGEQNDGQGGVRGGARRTWRELTEAERDRLLALYQVEVDRHPGTCAFDEKLARMQVWLGARGVDITEAEIRQPKQPHRPGRNREQIDE